MSPPPDRPDDADPDAPANPGRRSFFQAAAGTAVAGTGLAVGGYAVHRAVTTPDGRAVARERPESVQAVELRVNGKTHKLELPHQRTLLLALREDLGLTGTKKGCNLGQCGACTVLLGGEPVYSCFVLAADTHGAEIETIEGLERDGRLHPVQEAFVEHLGSQCGHCTPGMILSAVALLRRNPAPTESAVRNALAGNLCRCGNYPNEVAAVLAAAGRGSTGAPGVPPVRIETQLAAPEPPARFLPGAGPSIDQYAKATGRARYTGDLGFHPDDEVKSPLFLKVLRSPHAHANLIAIDDSAAKRLSGYRGLVTWDDLPGIDDPKVARRDRHPLNRKARFVGDAIAAVVADTQYAAQESLNALRVSWQPLPHYDDAERMLREDVKAVHDGGPVAGFGGAQPADTPTIEYAEGDLDAGFRAADRIVEGRYSTQFHAHAQIEPHVCIAQWNGNRLKLWDSQQSVFHAREVMADILRVAPADIDVQCAYVGGGFGGKCLDSDGKTAYQAIAAIAARKFGRPVRYEYTLAEQLAAEDGRNPFVYQMKTGVKNDGTITAMWCRAVQNTGAYASSGPAVCSVSGEAIVNTYRAGAFRYEGYSVYSNGPVGGEFRGFGHPQGVFARELHMDEVATALGMDPLEFRRRNSKRPGDRASFQIEREVVLDNFAGVASLETAAAAIGWKNWQPPSQKTGRLRRGLGLRYSQEHSGRAAADGIVWIDRDGRLHVPTGTGNIGTHSTTGIALVVAEVLGVPIESMVVSWADTVDCAWDFVTDASRSVHCNGKAFYNAAVDLERQLKEAAARRFGASAETVELRLGAAYGPGGRSASLRDLAAGVLPRRDFTPYFDPEQDVNPLLDESSGKITPQPEMSLAPATARLARRLVDDGHVVGLGHYVWNPAVQSWGASAAEVEVDMETGQVEVLGLACVHDCGRVIYRTGAEAQIHGGTIMGLGWAMFEELRSDPKTLIPVNARLHELRPPTMLDYPPITPVFVEAPVEAGPFGAKGLGENPVWNAAPAIGNAIYNATGVRVRSLPFTWEKVHRALHEAERSRA